MHTYIFICKYIVSFWKCRYKWLSRYIYLYKHTCTVVRCIFWKNANTYIYIYTILFVCIHIYIGVEVSVLNNVYRSPPFQDSREDLQQRNLLPDFDEVGGKNWQPHPWVENEDGYIKMSKYVDTQLQFDNNAL